MTKGEAIKVLKLYQKIADAFYASNTGNFSKGRLKFRKDVKESIFYALAVLERVEVDKILKVLDKMAEGNNCLPTMFNFREKVARSIFTSLTGEVGK